MMVCEGCKQSFDSLAIMALLCDLGCKGSCENAIYCYATENHEHKFVVVKKR